jgi:hypothetical protein
MKVLCKIVAHSRSMYTSSANLKPDINSLEKKATNNAGNKKHT